MDILVYGSVAYDRIMTFPGRLPDHVAPGRKGRIKVSFVVEEPEEQFGGAGGNIAYSLALLDETPLVVASVGRDFDTYEARLMKLGLSTGGLHIVPKALTASSWVMADSAGNQIIGFRPGAMLTPSRHDPSRSDPGRTLAVITATNRDDMLRYSAALKKRGVPVLLAPAKQTSAFTGDELLALIDGSRLLVVNEVDLRRILAATSATVEYLLGLTRAVVVTQGEEGTRILRRDREETHVPVARPDCVVDSTGAADAFKAGLTKGLVMGQGLTASVKMGAACASLCLEAHGAQSHSLTPDLLLRRLNRAYGHLPGLERLACRLGV